MARRKALGRAGPDGAIVVEPGTKVNGLRGVKGPKRTRKQLAALRSGGYRRKGAALDAAIVLASGNPNLPKILRAHERAYDGDFEDLNRINARRLGKLSGLHETAIEQVEREGLTVSEDAVDSEGRVIAHRTKAHPLVPVVTSLSDTLGISADAQLLTPKSRNVSKATEAATKYWNRQDQLRQLFDLSQAKPAINAEVVPPAELPAAAEDKE